MAGAVEKHNFPRRKRMTVEFGMATYPADAESPQELLEAVDKSLREASPAPGETEACALPVAM
jgi:GGDEF domain-containing protein